MKFVRMSLVLMFCVVLVAGCGRKGALEAPPGTPKAETPKNAPVASSTEPQLVSTGQVSGLQSTSSASAVLTENNRTVRVHPITGANPKNAPLRPKEPFFLDFLVE